MSGHGPAKPMTSRRGGPLRGTAHIPGDKSVSHRALILGALTVGETRIEGLLEGQDVLDTAKAMRAFGAEVERVGEGAWRVHGVGVGGYVFQPGGRGAHSDDIIDKHHQHNRQAAKDIDGIDATHRIILDIRMMNCHI